MPDINKTSLNHLAGLSRLELTAHEEEKFVGELEKILKHFEELQAVNTENVVPMTGGTELKNVFREDGATTASLSPDRIVEAFPEKKDHWLKVPAVFEDKK